MVTLSFGLTESENGVILVRNRLVYSVRSIGRRKSSYGFWGSAISSPTGPRAEPLAEIKHLKYFHDIGEPSFFYNRGSLQVMHQEGIF